MSPPDIKEVRHMNDQPIKLTLQKCSDGSYQWNISVQGQDYREMMAEVHAINAAMKKEYGKAPK